jgi:hypothetical protein
MESVAYLAKKNFNYLHYVIAKLGILWMRKEFNAKVNKIYLIFFNWFTKECSNICYECEKNLDNCISCANYDGDIPVQGISNLFFKIINKYNNIIDASLVPPKCECPAGFYKNK